MAKKKYLILVLLAVCLLPENAGAQNNLMWKSLILPGWGESTLGIQKKARIFYTTEAALWTSALASGIFSNYFMQTSKAYSAEHAGVDVSGKSAQYWIDIGNYNSMDLYNAEHQRWRDVESLYSTESTWYWDSENSRKKFENMRISGDRWALTLKFLGAGLVMNRIISAIDVIYLGRGNEEQITLMPILDKSKIGYQLTFKF